MKHLKRFENFEERVEAIDKKNDEECYTCDGEVTDVEVTEEEGEGDVEDNQIWGDETDRNINGHSNSVDSFSNFLSESKKGKKKVKLSEEQKEKLDKNKNGKIDAEDFEILRSEKKEKKLKKVPSLRERILRDQNKK